MMGTVTTYQDTEGAGLLRVVEGGERRLGLG